MNTLIKKYNVPVPRYTSYPTVPHWNTEEFGKEKWITALQKSFKESNQKEGISLYIHLPFCESMCTFCACHKHITKRHDVEEDYISSVIKEWELYCELFDEKPLIKEIHLGGGTPTFFAPKQLQRLIICLLSKAGLHEDYEFSFEGHPNNTTEEHLKTLNNLGFTRVSFGVQDYSLKVQKAINRIQPFEKVKEVTELAREIGYTSISHDLVFGLPFQNIDDVVYTIRKTKELAPDRISFYSYAHVPWIKGVGQRGFEEKDLPKNGTKRALYEEGKWLLEKQGYKEVGMDHFALETDELYKSLEDGSLHRNFMGYTARKTQVMIGLGMSAISDSFNAFAQNVKTVKEYQTLVNNGQLPVFRGHIHSEEDLKRRQIILDLMCQSRTNLQNLGNLNDFNYIMLEALFEDNILSIDGDDLVLTQTGKPFIRNVCVAFDEYLKTEQQTERKFSYSI
ncbi:MAG: oxygen-independent coproporphyrinogen III oxidase [Flavobacteriaceae bacterium]|nr:oxygen-independent coproporphyrinogen III oxidase [Flavobacteriaceae bacterium]|tara:strand:- start:53055 stop:54407 length:1353 start_codon:yes stop_codon:yes gene_type:complete